MVGLHEIGRRAWLMGMGASTISACRTPTEAEPQRAALGRPESASAHGRPESAPAGEHAGVEPGDEATPIEALAEQLEEEMPAGFSLVVEPPFVVLGDERPEMVARRAAGTVRWARDLLEAQLFDVRPAAPLSVWLFRNDKSYRHHAQRLFGHDPSTPYGYYSSTHRALVMNISTGGGTLVHEMVHPYVEADFPDCPAWLNEGLGSLYEQSAERQGRIVGLTNWRLEGLQLAIKEARLPSFRTLTQMGDSFYEDGDGDNYGQARYLCLMLQQRGLLEQFYRSFRSTPTADPTGFSQLQATLGEPDMAVFQQEWERWVMTLRFG